MIGWEEAAQTRGQPPNVYHRPPNLIWNFQMHAAEPGTRSRVDTDTSKQQPTKQHDIYGLCTDILNVSKFNFTHLSQTVHHFQTLGWKGPNT